MKKRTSRFFNHFWDHENGMSSMLFLLIIMQFVLIPIFGSYTFFIEILNIFWMLFLMAGIFSLATTKKQALQISIIPILFIVFSWISIFKLASFVLLAELGLSIGTFLLLIVLVLKKVLKPGPINGYRIIGSIVVYMLMAHLWTVVYVFFYEHVSGSFQLSLPDFESNSLQANFLYFSYVTLTTTGFGDVIPLHPFARAMVNLESIIGVLYPILLIGRLVSDANLPYKKTE